MTPPDPGQVAALPKADLHVHQEAAPRLDRVLARREERPPYDWAAWRRRLVAELPPGQLRLGSLGSAPILMELDDDEMFVARTVDILTEHASAGGCYVEVRCGGDSVLRDGFMELFRTAEHQVQTVHPHLRAEALAVFADLTAPADYLARKADACVRAAAEGLAGVDFIVTPYGSDADWSVAYRLAEPLAEAGLGITAHAGELTTADLPAAARMPGLTRIGHGVHAAYDPSLTQLLLDREVTLEVALSCNELFGVLPATQEHPLLTLLTAGVPVTLATDDPVQIGTTIDAEYAAAAQLGVDNDQLLQITRNAIRAAFTTAERRTELIDHVEQVARPSLH
ncbi:aminodeoxyfutalosine deaminase [Actinopolymorpha cephalotaxi]|uniref:adenosine deaminase n=1 Tax=Actinopolymorpha cephalotaxi TaxID=504797 RepID=A0A1I2N2H7_9ACTN|nr:hypothetical protein [Actinopolymorpha cephalotaxi]NYH85798.1 adenosine deaminase [Actinopolymorpha cephalotaxi]SFF95937.1 aminodeoxyfutalosine deaminase [Actinopolymorpha cephalotaxi]